MTANVLYNFEIRFFFGTQCLEWCARLDDFSTISWHCFNLIMAKCNHSVYKVQYMYIDRVFCYYGYFLQPAGGGVNNKIKSLKTKNKFHNFQKQILFQYYFSTTLPPLNGGKYLVKKLLFCFFFSGIINIFQITFNLKNET